MSDTPTSPLAETLKMTVDAMQAVMEMTKIGEKLDRRLWDLLVALTADPRHFPKAVLLGHVESDVAMIRFEGMSGHSALDIHTGADGRYEVYGDNYDEFGNPGRIIIELGHPVTAPAPPKEEATYAPPEPAESTVTARQALEARRRERIRADGYLTDDPGGHIKVQSDREWLEIERESRRLDKSLKPLT